MWDVLGLLFLLAVLAVLLGPRFIRPRLGADAEEGTLLITRVSARPDAGGEQFVTIVGVLHGPSVDEYEVYQRLAVDAGSWPKAGELLPVVYSPRNPDNFTLRRSS